MAEHHGRIAATAMLSVGAAFDFHSGHRKWAPAWVRNAGLEWIYRMLTGGRRVIVRNLKVESGFTVLILRETMASWVSRLAGRKRAP
jgi:N-acetylglucosaminyldiphosphoundecaprenol N-acetyl-beta-D-mannosaminyltransferase